MINLLSPAETSTLLLAAKKSNLRDYTMVHLALATGIRVSEIVGLFVEDVAPFGMVSPIFTVPPRITKNGKKREIPITLETRDIINRYLSDSTYFVQFDDISKFLFFSKYTSKPLSTRDFQRIVRTLSLRFLGRSVSPHSLRHTFATRLLKHSNIRVVQELLGHASVQTTQIYTHVNIDDAQSAVDKVGTLII